MAGSTFTSPLKTFGKDTSSTSEFQCLKPGTDPTNPVVNLKLKGTNNAADANIPTITNASMGQATTITFPDPGGASATVLYSGASQSPTFITITATTGNITTVNSTTVTGTTVNATNLQINSVAVDSTAAEINTRTDDSAMVDTRADSGAISTTTAYTAVTTSAAATITLAAPTKPAFLKIIKMTVDGGFDATLAMTNIVDAHSAIPVSTSITFDDVGDTIVLVSDTVSGKWLLIGNSGCTLA